MSTNKLYDSIEDEVIRALEQNPGLPERLSIGITAEALKALLTAGLVYPDGRKLPNTLTYVELRIADRQVCLQADTDPAAWVTN